MGYNEDHRDEEDSSCELATLEAHNNIEWQTGARPVNLLSSWQIVGY